VVQQELTLQRYQRRLLDLAVAGAVEQA
jgi:hypothetical protein